MKEIVIGRDAYEKIMYYVNKAKFEISGFGNVQVIKGVPTVTDVILCKQENSSTETEMSGESISKAIYEHHISGMEGELNFWWHSHVDMPVFWSGTDMEAINTLSQEGWFIHGVFNKKKEVRTAYSDYSGEVDVFMDDLGLKIDESLVSTELKSVQIEYDKAQDEIIEKLEIVQNHYEGIIDKHYKEIQKNQDDQFKDKVTDKTYSTNRMGGWKGFYEDNEWDIEMGKFVPKQMKNLVVLESGISGSKKIETSGNIFNDYTGSQDLLSMGYSVKEILYMQNSLRIEDFQDIIYYENELGVDINTVLFNNVGDSHAI